MFKELDEKTAYNKGKPIRSASELPNKFQTIPMDDDWIETLKTKHFYHENDFTEMYIKIDPKNGHRMIELREKLLSFGGQEVCLPEYEEDLAKILDRGQLWLGDRITMKRGLPSQCHYNSSLCWDANRDRSVLCTGYGLSEDGMWRPHSWCIHVKPRKNRVVETTVERIAYFGFVMTEEEAEEFLYSNT